MEKRKDLHKHPSVIELKTILNLTDVVIDSNPAHPKFRLGKALGKEFTHWLRAKFLNRRRLFFRYSSNLSTIIYVWAGNHNTLRKEGSKRDVYLLFRKMLLNGYPADNFSELLLESSSRNRDLIDDFALFYALLEKKK
jgi:toxin YhaV